MSQYVTNLIRVSYFIQPIYLQLIFSSQCVIIIKLKRIRVMKKFITLLFVLAVTFKLSAQAPQAVCYQAVATDTRGNELVSQSIKVRLSVLKTSTAGVEEWIETHSVITDGFGLFDLQIGLGTRVGGSQTQFSNIKWGSDKYYLKIEMDVTGGNSFVLMGTNQLVSVPYALYSDKSFSATYADSARIANRANTAGLADSAKYATRAGTAAIADSATRVARSNTSLYSDSSRTSYISMVSNYALKADSAKYSNVSNYANTANTANYALKADSAKYANIANYANTANTANFALKADSAKYANVANIANFALNARFSDTAKFAWLADSARRAYSAVIAQSAVNATNAVNSQNAVNAQNAINATNAVNAQMAQTARRSDTATFAWLADSARRAGLATRAILADSAAKAGIATKAIFADSAAKAGLATKATLADSASRAGFATNANHANTAGTATQALTALDDRDRDPLNEIQSLTFDSATNYLKLSRPGGGGDVINLSTIPLRAAGASIDYPFGIIGEAVLITSNYVVPSGKTLFISATNNPITMGDGKTLYVEPGMPMIPSNQVISSCYCSGILIDNQPYAIPLILDFTNAAFEYTVPNGYYLVLKSGTNGSRNMSFLIDGTNFDFFTGSTTSPRLVVIPMDKKIRKGLTNVSTFVTTGYLLKK
jgi:hypothetical protein